jgi:hypothetical protein
MESLHRNRRAVLALGVLLAFCPCAFALDPSLDINQYAHTVWKIRDGFAKGIIYAIAQTPDRQKAHRNSETLEVFLSSPKVLASSLTILGTHHSTIWGCPQDELAS